MTKTSIPTTLAIFALAACLGASPAARGAEAPAVAVQPVAAPPSWKSEGLPLDPEVRQGKLPNGLTYYIRVNKRPEKRAEVWLAVNAGSVQEDESQRGLAHFVEHMAFNGTRRFAKQALIDYLERIGMEFGPDVNAFTSFDETVYNLTVPTDDPKTLETAFQILEDWGGGVAFQGTEIDKERGVVLEEWRLGRGAQARVFDKQFPVIFHGSRYADRIVIGKREVIERAPHKELRRFYRDWYRPDLMAVVVVGDVDPAQIEGWIRKYMVNLRAPKRARVRVMHPVPDHPETLVTIETDPELTQSSVSVLYKLPKRDMRTVADYRENLIENLYHSLLNDRIGEILRRPDPPFLGASSSSGGFVRSKEVFVQSARVKDGEALTGLRAVLTEAERVERHGFTGTELERAKRETLRSMEQAYRERDKQWSAAFAWEYLSHFLEGEPSPGIVKEWELVQAVLPTISVADVNAVAQARIPKGSRVITFTGPAKEGSAPPAKDALLAVFREVQGAEIAAHVDRVREGPLVPEPPAPGEILETALVPEIGVTVWKLSNGARVVLKPTDFKNDEVRLSAWSPGGHSLVPDDEHVSAIYAQAVLGAGGIGGFDAVELQKALAGKMAGAGVSIGELSEDASGWASPQDLQTMFELLYLNFTAPRRDPDAVKAWLQRTRGSLENRAADPGTVFGDRWMEVVSRKHFRRRPATVERLEEIDLDEALRVHRDRFADAGDFLFVIVGNFQPDEIAPLVRTWIGGLPSKGRQEEWRDVGVPLPEPTRFQVRKGLEPKSQVRILYTGKTPWSIEERHRMRSLGAALRIRLREVLREDMGEVYGVGAGGSISRWPREEYSFQVSFGCAPENVEELIETVRREIAAFRESGPAQDIVEKVREQQRRSREVDLRENGFWLGALEDSYRHGLDPRRILDHETLVKSVTVESLRDAARLWLASEPVIGVLNPEAAAAPAAPAAAPTSGR